MSDCSIGFSRLVAVVLLLASIAANSQFHKQFDRVIKDSTLYLITSGNKSKTALIAQNFNLRDTVSTHVGIAFKRDGKAHVFHVTDVDRQLNALKLEPVDQFLESASVIYASLWRIAITTSEWTQFEQRLDLLSIRRCDFDYDFLLNNGDKLYCSEFCALLLSEVTCGRINFSPVAKPLDEFYRSVLHRDDLIYFPVDFFNATPFVTHIIEAYK